MRRHIIYAQGVSETQNFHALKPWNQSALPSRHTAGCTNQEAPLSHVSRVFTVLTLNPCPEVKSIHSPPPRPGVYADSKSQPFNPVITLCPISLLKLSRGHQESPHLHKLRYDPRSRE